jgi:hypothetical protein
VTTPDVGRRRTLIKQGLVFALAFGIWLTPVPDGLTKEAWHLFTIFSSGLGRRICLLEDGRVGGRAEGLKGCVRVGAPPPSAPAAGAPAP